MTDNRRDEQSVGDVHQAGSTTPAKQPYARPQLVDYGTIAELTQGGGGTQGDGVSNKRFIKG